MCEENRKTERMSMPAFAENPGFRVYLSACSQVQDCILEVFHIFKKVKCVYPS